MTAVNVRHFQGEGFSGYTINNYPVSFIPRMDVQGFLNLKMKGHCIILAHNLTATGNIKIKADTIICMNNKIESKNGSLTLRSPVGSIYILGATLISKLTNSTFAVGEIQILLASVQRMSHIKHSLKLSLKMNNAREYVNAIANIVEAIQNPCDENEHITFEEGLRFLNIIR